jgi:hypothetical protein
MLALNNTKDFAFVCFYHKTVNEKKGKERANESTKYKNRFFTGAVHDFL